MSLVMVKESAVLREVESCLAHHKFYVIPRDYKKSFEKEWSIWNEASIVYKGVIWRQNTGAMSVGKRFMRFGIAGLPDFLGFCFKTGQFIALEVKSEKGAISVDQAAFGRLCLNVPVLYALVRSYGDVVINLEKWGLSQ